MYKLLIFDWDGTIIDSAARIVSSMQQASRDLGYGELTDTAVRHIIGLGLPEALLELIPTIDEAGILAMRERYGYYYLGADNTPTELFDDVEVSLARLKAAGYRLGVATGKSRRGLEKVFDETGLRDLFEVSRCADETTSKPDPHMLHEILQETGVRADEALMIGDTSFDLEMAQRAEIDRVAMTYGAHPLDRLTPWSPVLMADQFIQLEQWLEQNR